MSNAQAIQHEQQQHIDAITQQFNQLLARDSDYFNDQIRNVLDQKQTRVTIDLDRTTEIGTADALALKRSILDEPLNETISTIEKSLYNHAREIDAKAASSLAIRPRLTVSGNFAASHITPRGLNASMLSKLIKVRGLVTNVSVPRARVITTAQYTDAGVPSVIKSYRDTLTSTTRVEDENNFALPTFYSLDNDSNLLHTEFGLSQFQDFQRVTIQEAPSSCPPGIIPRQLEIVLLDDLVDTIKPGDTCDFVGIYKIKTSAAAAKHTDVFQTYLLANNVEVIDLDDNPLDIAPNVEEYIRHIANSVIASELHPTEESPIFNLLAASVAPSIWGHMNVKKAIVLALAGGVAHKLDTGTRLRGDINILMVGDPGVAKSQLLRFVSKLAPYAVMTTGRGTTGVGLTAAVLNDKDTGERRLEAGAMVLADKGVMLIDELDKMSDEDRVALHEVMEQQVVTISKASIHAELNARCTVIAAANPLSGSYDIKMSPAKNINLPDTLLSRFDLLFVLLDRKDAVLDSEIAKHVLTTHTRNIEVRDSVGTAGYSSFVNSGLIEINTATRVSDDNDDLIQIGNRTISVYTHNVDGDKVFSSDFLKFYISYCKATIKPVLTPEANALINEYYVNLRSKSKDNPNMTTLITPRCLESLIRLSTAHAKIRLSETVNPYDVRIAYGLLEHALLTDFKPVETRRTKRNAPGGPSNGGNALISRVALNNILNPTSTPTRRTDLGSPSAATPFAQSTPLGGMNSPGFTPQTPGDHTPYENGSTPYMSDHDFSEHIEPQLTQFDTTESETVEELDEIDDEEAFNSLKDAVGQYNVLKGSEEVPLDEFESFCKDSLQIHCLTASKLRELAQGKAQEIITIDDGIIYFIV